MIIGACVVYNNVEIFKRTLGCFNDLCDRVVVVDDGSTDCTEIERSRVIKSIFKKPFIFKRIEKTKKEIHRRSTLWKNVCDIGNENNWVVLLDSDECVHKKDIKRLLSLMKMYQEHEGMQYIGTRLYNVWSETEYRVRGYWNPKYEMKRRIFKLKKGAYYPYNLNVKNIECGEIPSYVYTASGLNTECKLLHLGYITESERRKKYYFHKKVDPEGKFHLSAHIESIIQKPELVTLT